MEPERESKDLEQVLEDVQNLEPEQNNALSVGDLVQVNVTRANGDKTWNGLSG